VHIIDGEQERGAPPKVGAQPVEPVHDRERGVEQRAGNIIVLRRRGAEKRCRLPGRAGEELGPVLRRCRDERGLE
jgi:hypothetical protein